MREKEMKAETKEFVKKELVHLLKEDPEFRFEIFDLHIYMIQDTSRIHDASRRIS